LTSLSTTIGATEIPVPAGAAHSPIRDPLVVGLLDYLGHWIKETLDAKLPTLGGPDTVAVTDASPTATRYMFDPRGWWVRAMVQTKTPGLWIWHRGSKRIEYSTVHDFRERNIGLLYAFPELSGPRGMPTRAGLMTAVDAALFRALERGSHPTYQNGAMFVSTIAGVNALRVVYQDCQIGFEFAAPQTGAGAGGQPDGGFEQYGFMTLRATIMSRERVGADTPEDPADVNDGLAADIKVSELGLDDPVAYMTRWLAGPDGSQDGDEVL
jgi:hypothetical protein